MLGVFYWEGTSVPPPFHGEEGDVELGSTGVELGKDPQPLASFGGVGGILW